MFSIRILLLLLFSASAAWALTEQRVEKEFALTGDAQLMVDTDFGNIEVVRGDDNKIAVSVYRKIEGKDQTAEKEFIASRPLALIKQDNTVLVRARRDRGAAASWPGGMSAEARFIIRAPGKVRCGLQSGGGTITVSDLTGSFKGATGGGDLKFSRIRGPIKADSGGGTIRLESCEGSIEASTGGGRIDVASGGGRLGVSTGGGSIVVKGFNGDTKAETAGGALTVEDVRGNLSGETAGGSISAILPNPIPGDTDLETCAGAISVTPASDVRLNVKAEAADGSVTTEVPILAKAARKDALEGTINGGGNLLRLRTVAGHILIKSAN